MLELISSEDASKNGLECLIIIEYVRLRQVNPEEPLSCDTKFKIPEPEIDFKYPSSEHNLTHYSLAEPPIGLIGGNGLFRCNRLPNWRYVHILLYGKSEEEDNKALENKRFR